MTSQERVLLAIHHKEPDRVPISDAPWGFTIERWHNEGLPEGVSPSEYFGYEFSGIGFDISLQLPTEELEVTHEYRITRNSDGAIMKHWRHHEGTPELIDFTIKTKPQWEEHKHRLAVHDNRINWEDTAKSAKDAREKGLFITMGFGAGFTTLCNTIGTDRALMAMIDDPDWVKDMYMARARLSVDMAEEILGRGIECDAGWMYDDLGFKLRGFFSPAMYRELLMPAHKLICDCMKSHGKVMLLHSCGYVEELVPLLIETGYDVLQPLEVKAGNNMVELKQKYGDRLAFMGGIDVRAMADPDPSVIEREISTKLPAMKQGGGYIYHSDHSVPNNVSFPQYCRVMELVKEYGRYE